MDSIMPGTRVYVHEGVEITYLTYDTIKNYIVEKAVRAEYAVPTPTEDDPTAVTLRTEPYLFYRAMPSIVSVTLPETPPIWAVYLKQMIERLNWLDDPVKDFKQLERFAPTDTLIIASRGHQETREKALAAPSELQGPLIPVDEFDETITPEEKDAKKKTTRAAGPSLTRKSLPAPAKRSVAPMQTKR